VRMIGGDVIDSVHGADPVRHRGGRLDGPRESGVDVGVEPHLHFTSNHPLGVITRNLRGAAIASDLAEQLVERYSREGETDHAGRNAEQDDTRLAVMSRLKNGGTHRYSIRSNRAGPILTSVRT